MGITTITRSKLQYLHVDVAYNTWAILNFVAIVDNVIILDNVVIVVIVDVWGNGQGKLISNLLNAERRGDSVELLIIPL